MRHKKTLSAAALAALLLAGTSWTLDHGSRGERASAAELYRAAPPGEIRLDATENQFLLGKLRQTRRYDMLVAGDSRALFGVAPAVMGAKLPGLRIYNFGFPLAGWTGDYFDALEGLLDRDSPSRTLVLSVSPMGFTPRFAQSNGFTNVRRLSLAQRWEIDWLDRPASFFARWGDRRSNVAKFDFAHEDGWAANANLPVGPDLDLGPLKRLYGQAEASPLLIAGLLSRVSRWHAQGIAVYGFRPPTDPAVAALEDQWSGLDQAAFVARFRAAGGRWLSFDAARYRCTDGLHLEIASARRFSEDLAASLAPGARR